MGQEGSEEAGTKNNVGQGLEEREDSSSNGSKTVNVLDSWSDCVWAAGGSMCEAWSIMRGEAEELSEAGTSQGIVNPFKMLPFYLQVN